jgi:hypothetical protein
MSGHAHLPAGSQTVGPYFSIGLEYLMERTPAPAPGYFGYFEYARNDRAARPGAGSRWCSGAGRHAGVLELFGRRRPSP